ncbi:MAG: DNA-binding protein [Oscillospiraceae bacterium]|nr:DNA-binding protein [Oscillospiraceae bacterium]
MKYIRKDNTIVVRLEVGEELLAALTEVCRKEEVQLASISGIGATDDVTVGVFDTATKQYFNRRFTGFFEICSLAGNASRKDGECYLHIHMVFANVETGQCVGGHLNHARISATAEIFLHLLDTPTDRKFSEEIGINLLQF